MTQIDEYRVPSIDELDEERERLGLSRSELSRRMGREVDAWSEIVTSGIDPRLSTVRKVYDVLEAADPNDEQPELGRKPRLRSDGGTQEADDQ